MIYRLHLSRLAITAIGALILSFALIALPMATSAAETRAPELRIFEMQENGKQKKQQHQFYAANALRQNGATVAVGNIDGKGPEEIIIGAGEGEEPKVTVVTSSGGVVSTFMAYETSMKNGVEVASGDVNGDGKDEIITVTGFGAVTKIRVFTYTGKMLYNNGWYPFGSKYTGGAHIAVGNIRGNASEEVIVGTGLGIPPRAVTFTAKGKRVGYTLVPFGKNDKGGVAVAAANVDGGRYDEIVTAMQSFGESRIKVYKANSSKRILGNFRAYDRNFKGGINVAAADIDKDGVDEIITAPRQAMKSLFKVFEGHGKVVYKGGRAYEIEYTGGVAIAAGNVDRDSKLEIITVPQKKITQGRTDYQKYIDVDLSDQRLRAFENGVLVKEFAISSGVARFPTPKGTFPIRRKILMKNYEWSYGTNHPDNYDIPNVPYNLQFLPTYYLHNAFWHNNFGTPMSHGCININLENSKWVYHWADVGDPVIIHD